ncbi:hypothetical protein QAD02_000596 [Eretmocerus hayati]|uniref:Uncharacterized protein n=1 Tax=Eretmocerus hayati TaxID=131215 RepID=A0ACC2NE15_9HYME|nr:hypothetical protein QAD02_000596 [Eretmocerus hayati]
MDADDVANQLSEQSNSSLDLADEAARFSGKGIDQSGSRGKKRKRGHSEKVLALSKKRRTIFPLPTTWKLSEKIETICSNRGLKTVRKVANEAIPELFTQEELASCCPMGTKKSDRKRSNPDAADRSNPHSANRPGRPPLDAERLNALISRCWTRFSKDPNWYDDFKEALKYQMRLARKNILEEA